MVPIISVILPIYNTEEFVEESIRSVMVQSLKDIEIICVNDCSPDNGGRIAEDLAKEDERIRVIHHKENLGLGGARNTGILAAKAPWIASVDSDDRMRPDMLERLYDATKGGAADIVVCGFARVGEDGAFISKQVPPEKWIVNENHSIDIFRTTNPAFWNKLWRRSLFVDHDIFFPNHLYYQDSATTPRLLSVAQNVAMVSDVLYDYTVRDKSITFSYSDKHVLDYPRVFDVVIGFLRTYGLDDRYRTEFTEFVRNSLRHHAVNVDASDMDEEAKKAYLRRLVLLSESYLRDADALLGMEASDIVNRISGLAAVPSQPPKAVPVQKIAPRRHLPNLSVLVKTFRRPDMAKRFLDSVAAYEAAQNVKFREVIIGDDSDADEVEITRSLIEDFHAKHPNIPVVHDVYPFNIGLSDSRNRMVDRASGDLVLLCDDDFILDPEMDIISVLELFDQKDVSILGGWLKNHYDLKTGSWKYWGSHGKFKNLENELLVYLNERECGDFEESDFILNFFIAEKKKLQDVRWDPDLKIEEHYAFFYWRFKKGLKTGITKRLFVKHTNERPRNSKAYNAHRFAKETWEPALFNSVERIGKARRTVNRWRKDHFVSWQTNQEARHNAEIRVDLCEPVVAQRVAVRRITPPMRNWFFGYFDLQAISQDGGSHLCQSAPVMDRLPEPGDLAEIAIAPMDGMEPPKLIGETAAWCHQQGAQLQYRPGHPDEIIFNVMDDQTHTAQSRILNLKTGDRRDLPLPIAAIEPAGAWALSLNYARLRDYRAGYGYAGIDDPTAEALAPAEDGLFRFSLETGEIQQILNYAELRERFIVGRFPGLEGAKVIINHVGINTDGTKIVMLFRVFSSTAPFPTFTLVCDADGGNLREAFGMVSHYHWRDPETLLVSGAPVYQRKDLKSIELYELNSTTSETNLVDPNFFHGDGHATYSPDRRNVLYDCYASEQFPYRRLQFYDLEQKRGLDLGWFYSPPKLTGGLADCRCDLHPRWSPDGSVITFDSTHEGYRGVYAIDVEEAQCELERDIANPTKEDVQAWYRGKYPPPKPAAPKKPPAKPVAKVHAPVAKDALPVAKVPASKQNWYKAALDPDGLVFDWMESSGAVQSGGQRKKAIFSHSEKTRFENYVLAGDWYRERREYGYAAACYRAAVKLKPKAVAYWVQLGHMEKESGNPSQAWSAYEAAYRLTPDDPDLNFQIGHFYMLQREYYAAARYYRRAHRRAPENIDILQHLKKVEAKTVRET